MKRRLPFFISALLLSGVATIALRGLDLSKPRHFVRALLSDSPSVVPALAPSLRPPGARAETLSPQPVATAGSPASVGSQATPLREVRIRAVRDGRDYGWVQLPRGTRVELIRDEGSTLLIRFDQVTTRISRAVVTAGLVVPMPRATMQIAAL